MDSHLYLILKRWVLACAVLVLLITVFNFLVDPYLIFGTPRVAGFNQRKPAVDTQQLMMKSYDVLREQHTTILIGSSHVDWGLDAQDVAWPAQYSPVYNLSLPGGNLYHSYRYLQHLLSEQRPKFAVIGVDLDHFTIGGYGPGPGPPLVEQRFRVTPTGQRNPEFESQRASDVALAIFSLDALLDSAATVVSNWSDASADMVAGNWIFGRNHGPDVGTYSRASVLNLWMARDLGTRKKDDGRAAKELLERILELFASRGTDVILFINPYHVDYLELRELANFVEVTELRKHELLEIVTRHSGPQAPNRVSLWDFSGYNVFSTEKIPRTGRALYWSDTNHYTRTVGHEIILRIFGASSRDFGTRLTNENIDSWLERLREQHLQYRATHESEVRRIRDLYTAVTMHQPVTVADRR